VNIVAEQLDITEPRPKGGKRPPALSEGELISRLRTRYAAPNYALLHHVRNQTGFGDRTRTADAIAMSLWPSRGLSITGFEIKSHRSDWVSELAAPAKAEEIARHCDQWILVVGDREIVRAGELPATWGLLAPKGDGLVMVVEPKPHGEQSATVDQKFLAAILRNVHESSPDELAIKLACDKVRTECYQAEVQKREREQRDANYEVQSLKQRIADFETASGVMINKWDGESLGHAVAALKGTTPEAIAKRLSGIASEIEMLAKNTRGVAANLTGTGGGTP
jgi:hypothetical protein